MIAGLTPRWKWNGISPRICREVIMDGDLMERVFTNLASTLRAMGSSGGKLRVVAALVLTASGREITFQDSGPGIPPNCREQIFNPFSPQGNWRGVGTLDCLEDCVTIIAAGFA